MDPSYNNSNGNDGSGGINPGDVTQPAAPVQGVPTQSVAPSQPTAAPQPSRQINPITHRPINPVASNPMASNAMPGMGIPQQANFGMPQQTGFEMSQPANYGMPQPAGFGASGDIVLAGTEKKKPKIGAIVLVVALILLAVVAVGVTIVRTIGGGENGPSNVEAGDVKKAFNSYVNYVAWGKESDEDFEIEDVSGTMGYYESISDEDTFEQYLTKAQELYTNFANSYYENDADDMATSLDSINTYYHDYVAMLPLSMDNIRAECESGGKDAAVRLVGNYYSYDVGSSMTLDDYVKLEKELSELYISVVGTLNNNGCVVVDILGDGCYVLSESDREKIEKKMYESIDAQDAIYYNAMDVLQYVYDNIYGVGSDSNG